ncbi:AI-2E family transporter [Geobacter sp. DSM 9736]|uniref:AI-2E family transporter n=1 Tax=Geobacter sp. DSM 9736 TaxID=1277350 RepID=UPI000B50EF76|nr:AI-2E family transporter [Geobacter sp. DSM 9736]SNB46897.1 Predicted PurR-regulated permease PerM [Geobacter sp. DSM 9736]
MLIAVGIAVGVGVLLAFLWYTIDMLLLVFAGILVAVLLRAPASWVAARSPLSGGWSVALFILFLALVLWGGGKLVAAPVIAQLTELSVALPEKAAQVKQHLLIQPWGEKVVDQVESINWTSRRINVLGRMTGALSTAFGWVANLVIICFLGLYLAFQPDPYVNGLVRLFPVPRRHRVRQVLERISHTLRWWLVGTFLSMTMVGVLTWLGLWLLGMPLALALALLAAVFAFVPYLGPILSAVPAVLLAFTQSPQQALYVVLLYLAVQAVESNLLTPLVQQQAVEMPAAMMLFAQITLGVLVGGIGVVLATPLAAAAMVAVRMLYVEDVLGDSEGAG